MLGKKGRVRKELFNACTGLEFNNDVSCTVIGISNDGWMLCKFPFQHAMLHKGSGLRFKLVDGDCSEDNDCLWLMEKYVEVDR